MTALASNRRAAIFALLGVAIALELMAASGCGGGSAATGDADRSRAAMRMVGIEYGRYLGANGGQPPADEAALRTFIEQQISRTPDYGVKSVDELLGASRDGQPLKIVVGKKVAPPDSPDMPWAAYEQTGVDGKRLVVNTRGAVTELPADEVERMISP